MTDRQRIRARPQRPLREDSPDSPGETSDRPRPAADRGGPGAADPPPTTAQAGPTSNHDLTATVARAQQGDEQAFRQIYRAAQPGLLQYARSLVGETDAEDVTAEAWVCIARDLHRFRGDGRGFLGWAATITHHRAADHLRRRRPAVPLDHDHLPERTAPLDTEGQAEEALGTKMAFSLIAQLPEDQARAILLRVIIGLDTATAARILGKRTGAVRTAAHRGLRTLAQRLSEDESEPRPDVERQVRASTAARTDRETRRRTPTCRTCPETTEC